MAGNKGNGFNDSDINNLLGGFELSPEQLAVITALLINALEVESVLLNKDQQLQILLQGSLKKKTEKDRFAEIVSGMSVGDLFDSLLNR